MNASHSSPPTQRRDVKKITLRLCRRNRSLNAAALNPGLHTPGVGGGEICFVEKFCCSTGQITRLVNEGQELRLAGAWVPAHEDVDLSSRPARRARAHTHVNNPTQRRGVKKHARPCHATPRHAKWTKTRGANLAPNNRMTDTCSRGRGDESGHRAPERSVFKNGELHLSGAQHESVRGSCSAASTLNANPEVAGKKHSKLHKRLTGKRKSNRPVVSSRKQLFQVG